MLKSIIPTVRQASTAALVAALLFVLLEPAVSYGNQITISQTVTTEVAFTTNASNVSMAPALGGITGGTASGATQFAVATNDITGYIVTIQASSSVGMIGIASSTNSIPAYVSAVPGVPDFAFTVPANKAYFGYTVNASTTSDLAQNFLNDGATCGTGALRTALAQCWIAATSTPYIVLNRNTPTTAGAPATSTVAFQVTINANPNPTIPNDIYVATTTLTAIAK